MPSLRLIQSAFAVSLMAVGIGACTRENTAPELQTTSGPQPRAEPKSVSGCLRMGVGDNTYVLIASETAGATTTATYQLTGRDMASLQPYVGQTVEVSGTLRAEQEIASSGGTVAEKPAKGTSGTPAVETKSDLNVRTLKVGSVKPLGVPCSQ